MPKKLKLDIEELKIKSFVTSVENEGEIKGGMGRTKGESCPTSTEFLQCTETSCPPTEYIGGCPETEVDCDP